MEGIFGLVKPWRFTYMRIRGSTDLVLHPSRRLSIGRILEENPPRVPIIESWRIHNNNMESSSRKGCPIVLEKRY